MIAPRTLPKTSPIDSRTLHPLPSLTNSLTELRLVVFHQLLKSNQLYEPQSVLVSDSHFRDLFLEAHKVAVFVVVLVCQSGSINDMVERAVFDVQKRLRNCDLVEETGRASDPWSIGKRSFEKSESFSYDLVDRRRLTSAEHSSPM